jgi:hypothetical protein
VTGITPQQRAAETRKDRAQLAALADEFTELRGDMATMRWLVRRWADNANYLVRISEEDRVRRGERPALEVIVNDRPRRSRRQPAQLRLVGSDR